MQHSTSCLTKCEDTLYRNLKDHLPEIALAHHNTAFNSAMKCTPFEAMYGLRAKTITEAGASPRLHITAEEGTELTGLQEPDYNKWKSTILKIILQTSRAVSQVNCNGTSAWMRTTWANQVESYMTSLWNKAIRFISINHLLNKKWS